MTGLMDMNTPLWRAAYIRVCTYLSDYLIVRAMASLRVNSDACADIHDALDVTGRAVAPPPSGGRFMVNRSLSTHR